MSGSASPTGERWPTTTQSLSLVTSLLLPKLPAAFQSAGRRVELRHRMDGRLAVVYQEEKLGLVATSSAWTA